MTEKTKNQFMNKILLQVKTNRLAKGDKRRDSQEWAMIVVKHVGDLMEAVMKNDKDKIDQEVFHIAAPLLELYKEVFHENDAKEPPLVFPENRKELLNR